MNETSEQVRIRGKTLHLPAVTIHGTTVVTRGRWIRIGTVKDEEEVPGEPVANPDSFIAELKSAPFRPDIFTFAQKFSETRPKYNFHLEWDNAAVIPLRGYSDWWDKRLSQDARRNVRRAAKMGVAVQSAQFDDSLVKGIKDIYDETPVRQGTRFAHYQKDFEVVKREAGTYLDRSEYIGAYYNGELIGFIKLTYTDNYARLIHILSKAEHADKRPTNALIAKAVEIAAKRGLSYLTYCKYIDGGNAKSALTEFKRRNGFEQLHYPRYFVPLTMKGRIALALRLHRGLRNNLPKALVPILLNVRSWFFSTVYRRVGRSPGNQIIRSAKSIA